MKKIPVLCLTGILFLVLTSSCTMNKEELKKYDLVENVDLERYSGKWYEIARYPHSFEKDLVGVTATYTLRDDGKMDVLNEGYKGSLQGKHKKSKAYAKIPDPEFTAWLKVYFFWPFGANYFILELDTLNYHYALVGSSSDKYLWILSRTPQMAEETYLMLLKKAELRGYDTSKLQKVEQKTEQ